ncbi:MAG: hypothetical protein SPI97_01875 [Oscillospiraceae bacterium]|nr:hypothetical protein [Oscillospiraceae bacterium]
MEFVKKKSKIIVYYSIFYLLTAMLFLALFSIILKNNYLTMISEAILLISIIASLKLHINEINQTVKVDKESIECRNFVVKGRTADAMVRYEIIKKNELKRIPFKPFARCLYISIKGDLPVVINDDYNDYLNLWKIICDNCKAFNVNIDKKISLYFEKHKIKK